MSAMCLLYCEGDAECTRLVPGFTLLFGHSKQCPGGDMSAGLGCSVPKTTMERRFRLGLHLHLLIVHKVSE